ncbi:hypothetical protein P5G65_20000 [Paenibacillus chondroitinus]|uniref:DUF3992 domain-containing protein n=1 Tax=Paenibacillus chondroitinus TaxID=59842 RepID=A0ABU6DH64_9BACL|nr:MULTISPECIES: hypothetical protein [Paenibacillus]MCY9658584.1 hypothetical protein [Paenibacillus anseongense]MEB4796191.1 hypothetical protein [Paenibacillus chondroitinus]
MGAASVNEPGTISTFSLTPTTVSCGSGYCNYSNVQVKETAFGFITAYFYANYTIVDGGNDYIGELYPNYKITVIGGSYDNETLSLYKPTESLQGPANAFLRFQYNGPGSSVSTTFYVYLNVGNNTASSSQG